MSAMATSAPRRETVELTPDATPANCSGAVERDVAVIGAAKIAMLSKKGSRRPTGPKVQKFERSERLRKARLPAPRASGPSVRVEPWPVPFYTLGWYAPTMTRELTYNVPGMTCGHCKAAVAEEVGAVAGVESIVVDLETKLVVVRGDGVDDARVRKAIQEAGYEAA